MKAFDTERGRVFKRLETDAEFLARIRDKYKWWGGWGYADLDTAAWEALKMQRRIIEDEH